MPSLETSERNHVLLTRPTVKCLGRMLLMILILEICWTLRCKVVCILFLTFQSSIYDCLELTTGHILFGYLLFRLVVRSSKHMLNMSFKSYVEKHGKPHSYSTYLTQFNYFVIRKANVVFFFPTVLRKFKCHPNCIGCFFRFWRLWLDPVFAINEQGELYNRGFLMLVVLRGLANLGGARRSPKLTAWKSDGWFLSL